MMKKVGFFHSIQLKFIIIYILLLLIAVQVIGSYFASEIESDLVDTFKESINDRVDLLNYNLAQTFSKDRSEDDGDPTLEEDVQNIINDIDIGTFTHLQIINNQSRVIGTNDYQDLEVVGKKIIDDMVQKSLLFGSPQEDMVLDAQTENQLFVKAQPIFADDESVVGVIYLESSLEGVYSQLQNINDIFLKGSILAISVSALLGILVARTITKPIIEMRQQAQTMAKGDFSQKVNVYGTDEISHLAETFNDLNDRLKYSMAKIEKEQRKLSSVLSNMSEGVIATDLQGRINLINEAAGRLLGRNPNLLMNENLIELLEIEDRVTNIEDLQTLDSLIIDLSDDDIYLLQANFSIIVDENEELTGFITVISDVTEQEKVEQERREFVSNVSHELRTPLTTMRSYLEALSDGAWQDNKIAPKFLKVTQEETERMIRLVNDLLQLSRMDQKEYILHRRRIDFIQYFHRVIDRFEMNLREDILLKRNIPKGPFYVWLDEDKMTQVIDNIISNAIKYSPEGGTIYCRVSVLDDRGRRNLLIAIEDEGMGIPYEYQEKIFDRFYRADKARTRQLGGSGLGLAISKELVEAHYGSIWLESTEGKGTTFFFTLPLMSQKRGNRS